MQEVAMALYNTLLDEPMVPPEGIYGALRITARHKCWAKSNKRSEKSLDAMSEDVVESVSDASAVMMVDQIVFANAMSSASDMEGIDIIDPYAAVRDGLDRDKAVQELESLMQQVSKLNPSHLIASCWTQSTAAPQIASREVRLPLSDSLLGKRKRNKARPYKDRPETMEFNQIRLDLGLTMVQYAIDLGAPLGRVQSVLYGDTEIEQGFLENARSLMARDDGRHARLQMKWAHLSMDQIIDQWGELIATTYTTREKPSSNQAMILGVLSPPGKQMPRSTVWRWKKSRPPLENLEDYDRRIREYVSQYHAEAAKLGKGR